MKIRHRIMLWVAGAGFFTSLVFSLVVFLELREQPLEMIDAQLKTAAAAVAKQLVRIKPLMGAPEIVLPVSSEHYWIKVYDQDLRTVYESELSRLVDLPLYRDKGEEAYMISEQVPKKRMDLHQGDEDNVTFRVRSFAEDIRGVPYLIQIAKPMEDLEEEISDLLAAIGIGLVVSTILLVGLSYVLAGRIVKPIAAINQLARDINENTLEKRIPLSRSRDEIHDLAACLNEMFDRFQFSFLDNAIKYNAEEGRIVFKAFTEKGRIHLTLYNTGPGIPKEDLPKVFEPFYRVDKSRSTKHGGAGLGLAIVREIVRLHKGTVFIESQQGLWTRVNICLPRLREEDAIVALPQDAISYDLLDKRKT